MIIPSFRPVWRFTIELPVKRRRAIPASNLIEE